MFMMNGCQKKASETETTKQTTAQSESTAQTEAATTYTSESNSFSFDLPDSAWVATKEGIENKWAFRKKASARSGSRTKSQRSRRRICRSLRKMRLLF